MRDKLHAYLLERPAGAAPRELLDLVFTQPGSDPEFGPRFLLGLPGAGHSDAVESQTDPPIPTRDAAQRATIAFLNAVFRGADAAFDDIRAALAAEGNIVQAQRE